MTLYCPVCGEGFGRAWALKGHFEKHPEFFGDRCPICGFRARKILNHYTGKALQGDPLHIMLYYLTSKCHRKTLRKAAINFLSDTKYYMCLRRFSQLHAPPLFL